MNNQIILLNRVLEEYTKTGNYKDESSAFERFATEQIFKDQDIGMDEIEHGLIGSSRDGGIDGFYLFVNDEPIFELDQLPNTRKINIDLFLVQYKNSASVEEIVLDRFLGSVPFIFNLGYKEEQLKDLFHDDLVQKITTFQKIWIETANKHPQINVNFIHSCKGDKTKTLGPKINNEAYISKMSRLKEQCLELGGESFTVGYQIIDANWLLENNRKEKTYSLKLKLNENPIAIDYKEESQRGYIASVNIYEYYKFLCNDDASLRKYLFESNIRDYQNGTIVNEEMKKTVSSETDLDFWWLNNGVTIIAENGSLSGKILNLDNIQIVNGLQTSQSIYNVMKEGDFEKDERSLMLKIIITKDRKTTDAIIKATNSQNHIPASSLRATDQIQREIEEYLLTKGYYYDRRKNFYKNEGKPRKNIISISYMSQCLTALLDRNPSKARSNPTTLIKTEADYKRLFHKGRNLEVYYTVIKIMKYIETCLKEFSAGDSVEENITNNYKFHVGRILVSYLLEKNTYNDREFLEIEMDKLDFGRVQQAVSLLKQIILEYQTENGKKDLVNISKTVSFSEYITKNLFKAKSV
ncbi:AIPR family protein [Priestia aryabhattai]|uniref:AIPR family protein n=1 Tax=Priestia aryabhattai TaxID=412384 RepID=UPI002E1B18E1|nr:AIPR family protein [Priestia aryabhattai]